MTFLISIKTNFWLTKSKEILVHYPLQICVIETTKKLNSLRCATDSMLLPGAIAVKRTPAKCSLY